MIPEDDVADPPVRLALDRRLAEIEDEHETRGVRRRACRSLGPLPSEVNHLLQIVAIKTLARRANVEKIDAVRKAR